MLKKNLFYNSLLSISQFIFPLITFPYASRILGPKGIGSVNFIDSFTQYFMLFSALGIPVYGVREIAKVRENSSKVKETFNQIVSIHFISAIIFSIIYGGVALSVPDLRDKMHLIYIGMVIVLSSVFSLEWLFQGIGQFSYITKRTLIIKSISIILLFVFLKPNSEPYVYYWVTASVFILNGLSNIFYVHRILGFKPSLKQLDSHIKPLVIILASNLAVSIYVLLDNIILGFLKDDSAVGYYSTAVRIVKIPFTLIGAISSVIIPQVSLAFSKNQIGEINSLINKSFTFICIVGVPISFGMYVSSEFLVLTFAGSKFEAAINVLKIMAPAIFIIGLSNIFGIQILTPTGQEKKLLLCVILGMVMSISMNLILIPYLSYIGAAITNIVTEILVTSITFFYARRYLKFNINTKIFFQTLFVSALFIPIAHLIRLSHINTLYREIIIIISCSIFYSIFMGFVFANPYIESIKESIFKKLKIHAS